MYRRLATLTTLAALTLATLPAIATTSDCDEAQADFWATWEAEAHELTRPVALAARAVYDACPQEESEPMTTSESGDDAINDLHRQVHELKDRVLAEAREAAFGKPGHIKTQTDKTQGALCGFTTAANSGPRDAQLQGWIMVGPHMESGTDTATGSATYDALTGYIHVNAIGTIWGVDTNTEGTGTLYFHGVPFPIAVKKGDVVQAEAGCGIPPGPELCWGSGYGNTPLPIGAISVAGYFHDCD